MGFPTTNNNTKIGIDGLGEMHNGNTLHFELSGWLTWDEWEG